jgi:hypothetical protein
MAVEEEARVSRVLSTEGAPDSLKAPPGTSLRALRVTVWRKRRDSNWRRCDR